jgi:hypothetical protein
MDELPFHQQPPGYIVLYRAERPPGCMSVDRATDIIPGGSRGRWFTSNPGYALQHLSPLTLANLTRARYGIPYVQRPLRHPERYPGVWRFRAITLPERVVFRFFTRNRFVSSAHGERFPVVRRVSFPTRQAKRFLVSLNRKRALRLEPGVFDRDVYLLPRDVVAQASVLKEGGHLEVWNWVESYLQRDMKPVPDDVVNITVDDLEKPETYDLEILDVVSDPIPEAWKVRAAIMYPLVRDRLDELDGETEDDVLQLAAEVSEKLASGKRRRLRRQGMA